MLRFRKKLKQSLIQNETCALTQYVKTSYYLKFCLVTLLKFRIDVFENLNLSKIYITTFSICKQLSLDDSIASKRLNIGSSSSEDAKNYGVLTYLFLLLKIQRIFGFILQQGKP